MKGNPRRALDVLLEDVAFFLKRHEDLSGVLFWVAVLGLFWLFGDSCRGGGRFGPDSW